MKKRNLLVLSLLSVLAIGGLTACASGTPGPKGDQGEKGEPGEPGQKGEQGEPGEPGSKFLYGETDPEASLGNDGDTYQNTTTGDLFVKENGAWKFIYNNKGEDGKPGESGRPGTPGGQGQTSWSNTYGSILDGKVTQDKGSYLVGEDVIFTIEPADGYLLSSFTLNGEEQTLNAPTENVYTYSTAMVENGFFVSAEFSLLPATGEEAYIDGVKHQNVIKDGFGNVISEGTVVEDAPQFEGGSGTKEDPILVSGDQLTAKNVTDSGVTNFELTENVTLNEKLPLNENEEGEKELNLNLADNTLTVDNKTTLATACVGETINVTNGDIVVADNSSTVFALGNEQDGTNGGKLNLSNVKVSGKDGNATYASAVLIGGDAAEVTIEDSEFNCEVFPFTTNASKANDFTEGVNVTIKNTKLDALSNTTNRDSTGFMVNIPGKFLVEDSYIAGGRQAVLVRNGDVTIKNTTIEYSTNYYNNPTDKGNEGPYYDESWKDGNRVATAAIVVGDNNPNSYIHGASLTLENVKYVEKDETEATTLLTEETEKLEKPYQLYVVGENSTDQASLVKMDEASYKQFDSSRIKLANEFASLEIEGKFNGTKLNTFVDGQFYSKAVFESGTLKEELSTKVEEVKFDGGEGTETDPLLVSSYDQVLMIDKLYNDGVPHEVLESLHYSQTQDIVITNVTRLSEFLGQYNGNNYMLSVQEGLDFKGWFPLFGTLQGKEVSFKNIKLGVRENQAMALFFIYMWNDKVCGDLTIDGFEVVSLDNKPVRTSLNNYGFITSNPIHNTNEPVTSSMFVKNVKINASIENNGTCVSPLIGSGLYSGRYDEILFENIEVNGTYCATTFSGLLYGNPTYTSPNYSDPNKAGILKDGSIVVKNVTFNGKCIGLKGNLINVGYTPGNDKLINEELSDEIKGEHTFIAVENNLLTALPEFKFDSSLKLNFIDDVTTGDKENYTLVPYAEVGTVYINEKDFANGVQGKLLNNEAVESLEATEGLDIKGYKALDSNLAKEKSLIDDNFVFDLDFYGTKAGLVFDKETSTLYFVVEVTDRIVKVDSTLRIGFYLFDENGYLVGVK